MHRDRRRRATSRERGAESEERRRDRTDGRDGRLRLLLSVWLRRMWVGGSEGQRRSTDAAAKGRTQHDGLGRGSVDAIDPSMLLSVFCCCPPSMHPRRQQ